MQKFKLDKWTKREETEGMLYFAQTICELLDDNSLDTYKAPALNLHISFLELSTLISLFVHGRIKKGSLSFSIKECEHRIKTSAVLDDRKRTIFSSYLTKINKELEKNEANSNKHKLMSVVSAATSDLSSFYWATLLERIEAACSNSYKKSDIRLLCLEFATELGLRGFSKQYSFAKAKKYFFSSKVEPKELTSVAQIKEFMSMFENNDKEWEVCFIGNKVQTTLSSHMKSFGIKILHKTPSKLSGNDKYRSFIAKKQPKQCVFSIADISALEPHTARRDAELQLHFYADVCRFHQHDAVFSFQDDAFVCANDRQGGYIIHKQKRPMECGVTYKNAESIAAAKATVDILSGKHFTRGSRISFHKALDFHHAAMMSNDMENQLLDLWAALEGFLPVHDGSCDRILWYLNYILPALTLSYNEKIFRAISSDIFHESDEAKQHISSLGSDVDFFTNTVKIIASSDLQSQRSALISAISENPMLRNRIDILSKDFHSVKSIRKVFNAHRDKLSWHIQRIYTLRNQIAHNASSLPYIVNLVENLHDYLDTIILSVSMVGKQSETMIDIQTALEKLSATEDAYIASLSGDVSVDSSNCIEYVLGRSYNVNYSTTA